MPTYEYECSACGHKFEEFQSITAKPTKKCPVCGKRKVVRLISAGSGFIFKGSGFYQTDYRSESYKAAAKNDVAPAAKSDAKSEAKSETKSETKSESKVETKSATKSETKSESKAKTGSSESSAGKKSSSAA